jgi:hypothetical protein
MLANNLAISISGGVPRIERIARSTGKKPGRMASSLVCYSK